MQKEVKKDENIHTSVLLKELVDAIETLDNTQNIIVDATLGLAGHAEKILEKMHSGDIFVGFDTDERNLILAEERLKHKQNTLPNGKEIQIILVHSNFENIEKELFSRDIQKITGIYYDL